MKILTFDQGSHEWEQARLGIPTTSCFDKILPPKTRKPGKGSRTYMMELLAEFLMGQPLESFSGGFMERGHDLEDEARKWYAFETGQDVEKVGFVLRDDGNAGCSPDGLVGAPGGLEIKNPGAAQHVRYLVGEPMEHIGQTQGGMYITDREWWDMISYHPDLPPVKVRVERDEKYMKALVPVLAEFIEELEALKVKYAEHRVLRPWDPEIIAEMDASG